MYKRIIAALLAVFMLGALTSCNIQKKITDGILKGIFGKDIKVDDDGITIIDEEGKVTIGGGKWPTGLAADHLPKFSHGEIITAINTDEGLAVAAANVKEEHYREYVQQVKQKGFVEEPEEHEVQGSALSYVAYKGKAVVGVVYSIPNETIQITLDLKNED